MVQENWLNPTERKLVSDVEKDGWSCVNVAGEAESPTYSFTVGLERAFGHPEMAVFWLPQDVARSILTNAVSAIRAGRRFDDGHVPQGLAHLYATPIVEVPEQARKCFFGLASSFYQGTSYRVLQIAWPDRTGTFPWQRGVDPVVQAVQPVLWKDPYWTELDARQRTLFDRMNKEVVHGLWPKILSWDYEILSQNPDWSRTVRFVADTLWSGLEVVLTVFDAEEGLFRIESVRDINDV